MIENTKPIKLVYWNIRGLAQPIRHILQYLQFQYHQFNYTCPVKWFNQDLDQVRKICLFPSLPYIQDQEYILSQTVAISKYLCKKAGRFDLIGKTIEDQAKIDQLLAKFVTHRNKLSQIFKKQFLQDPDERIKKQKLNNFYMELMANQYIPTIIKILATNDWLLGYLTIADFFAYESFFYINGIYPQKMMQYKQVNDFLQKFENIPQIKLYNQSPRLILKTFLLPMKNIWKGNSKYY